MQTRLRRSLLTVATLLLLAVMATVRGVTGAPTNRQWTEPEQYPRVVAFYNVFAQGNQYKRIVSDQTGKIAATGLYEQLDAIYYATMGSEGRDLAILGSKYEHVAYFGKKGDETQTLSLLHDYCSRAGHADTKVLYFHNKGSFHFHGYNEQFREFLDCFNLNPHCIDALDTHDTCGWRISPVPHPHYSGNFWWATCRHIRGLVDPMSMTANHTFEKLTNRLPRCVYSYGRYFAESWIGSAPIFRPADCMNASVESSYLFGYRFPEGITQRFCPALATFFTAYQQFRAKRSIHSSIRSHSFGNYWNRRLADGDVNSDAVASMRAAMLDPGRDSQSLAEASFGLRYGLYRTAELGSPGAASVAQQGPSPLLSHSANSGFVNGGFVNSGFVNGGSAVDGVDAASYASGEQMLLRARKLSSEDGLAPSSGSGGGVGGGSPYHLGSVCSSASTMIDLSAFMDALTVYEKRHMCERFPYDDLVRRAQIWYGREPETYQAWMGGVAQQFLAPLRAEEEARGRYYFSMLSPFFED